MQGHEAGAVGARRTTRLPKFDYTSPGRYFVTVCTRNMESLFGSVGSDGQVTLTECGHIVEACWLAIPEHFPNVALDTWVTMPNHLHGIVTVGKARATHASPLRTSPTKVVGGTVERQDREAGMRGRSYSQTVVVAGRSWSRTFVVADVRRGEACLALDSCRRRGMPRPTNVLSRTNTPARRRE